MATVRPAEKLSMIVLKKPKCEKGIFLLLAIFSVDPSMSYKLSAVDNSFSVYAGSNRAPADNQYAIAAK